MFAFVVYAWRCWGNGSGECEAIRKSPPWTILTALAASPAVLLTWYWRTEQKERDIDQARAEEINSRFAKAVELLGDGHGGAVYALEGVARDAPDQYHGVVYETLATAVRGWSPSERMGEPLLKEHVRLVLVQALIRAIGRRNASHDTDLLIDLSFTDLGHINFWRLNFANVRFVRANMQHADLRGAILTGANFENLRSALLLKIDDTTVIDADTRASLERQIATSAVMDGQRGAPARVRTPPHEEENNE
jgi:uncharacterized protein YjbI with pentapeptide repeats